MLEGKSAGKSTASEADDMPEGEEGQPHSKSSRSGNVKQKSQRPQYWNEFELDMLRKILRNNRGKTQGEMVDKFYEVTGSQRSIPAIKKKLYFEEKEVEKRWKTQNGDSDSGANELNLTDLTEGQRRTLAEIFSRWHRDMQPNEMYELRNEWVAVTSIAASFSRLFYLFRVLTMPRGG